MGSSSAGKRGAIDEFIDYRTDPFSKTPIFGPEEAKTTKCAKNTKNSNDFATEFTKPEAWTAERG